MIPNRMRRVVRGLACLIACQFFALAHAQEGQTQPTLHDLASYQCKDIMRIGGAERELALGVLHGYIQGSTGRTVYDVDKLSKATDEFVEYCLDNPSEGALASLTKIVKGI